MEKRKETLRMVKLQRGIDKVSTGISSVLLGIMMVILFYNVIARFVGGGIQWYMESSQYLNVWAMLLTGVGACAMGQHLRIAAVDEALKGKAKVADHILVAVCTVAFYLLFAYGTFLLASKSKQDISTMAPLKMAYIYWPMPFIGLLSAFSTVLQLVIELTGAEEKEKAE